MGIERARPSWIRAFGASRSIPLVLALVLPIAAGCENEGPPPAGRRRIAINDLPQPVLKAATKQLPGISFEEAWENLDRDRKVQSYEIKGRAKNGKIRECRVGLDAKILEVE